MRRILLAALLASLALSCAPRASAQDAPAGQPPPQQGEGGGGGPRGGGGRFRGNGVFGRIQSASPAELKITTQDGGTVTVHLTPKTEFRMDQQPARVDDFKVGTVVFVRGTKTGDAAWDAEAVSARSGGGPPGGRRGGPVAGPGGGAMPVMGKDVVAGTVKAIDGTKLTILRLDSVTQTVELDENTSLTRRRESITLADVHVGDAVSLRGETKDGAFIPRSLNLMTAEQLERMKQFLNGGGAAGPGNPPPAEKKPEPETKPPQEQL